MNPKSLANLKPIQKGEVRNPKGLNGSKDGSRDSQVKLWSEVYKTFNIKKKIVSLI